MVKFPESYFWTVPTKNKPLFILPGMGLLLKIFALGIPLHANVFSFMHNAVVLSQFRCVHPKIRWKFVDSNIFMNQNKCPLHKTWSDLWNNVVHCKYRLVERQIDLLLYTVNCCPQWATVKNMAVSYLAFFIIINGK